ncbi:MAG TPA: NAD(P)H-dependent oxidoreductase subunit E, partial [Candidatus Acidoferrum sp.]|nr:NAD(P)H-dependent oxidoreductase subunit E [Candidatus Acidoferrum sp.]
MDLHVVAPLASPAERAAVDAVLDPEIGPPKSGWVGGTRAPVDGHMARGGHEARSRRDLLLPALHGVQSRIGWISQPALSYICRRLTVPPAEAYGVATFYALFATTQRPPIVAHVCDDIACRIAGGEDTCAALEREIGPAGEPGGDGRVTWLRSPCLGLCERAPAAMVTVADERPRTFTLAPVDAPGVVLALAAAARGTGIAVSATPRESLDEIRLSVPQAGDDGLRLLARVGRVDPASLTDYRASGGYEGLARALELGAQATIDEVTASKLLGRGGAAFPTGRKWAAVATQQAQPHYLVCNADESEPGTFKDRVLIEHDPFALVEGMTIEAFATGASRGYLYLRGEYPLAAERIASAIAAAREAGLLGPDILGSSFAFDIELRRGAGAYICGEETALFESIEGGRGEPRNKPPFPVEVGLFGKPTAINNVETLVNVPLILRDGAAAFAAIGTEGSTGPKLFCLSGHVERPGVYEVPFGTTLRELLAHAGGVSGGRGTDEIQTILLGGAAGTFVAPSALDTQLTFEGTRAIGAAPARTSAARR